MLAAARVGGLGLTCRRRARLACQPSCHGHAPAGVIPGKRQAQRGIPFGTLYAPISSAPLGPTGRHTMPMSRSRSRTSAQRSHGAV